MCGIAGYHGDLPGAMPPRLVLERMIDAIAHRGPDEHGFHVGSGAGLGHARLSIIDLSAGQQPMSDERGDLWVSFNGEIFNYIELQQDLSARGHRFRTHSDTEVILHAYQHKGHDCVRMFNGDFAFALWDRRTNQLMLARDRMGVRPLYYTLLGQTLVFASEVKALLQVPGVAAEMDAVAIDQCFTFWFPLAPRTPFKGIYELPPGHVLISHAGRIAVRPYWQLTYPRAQDVQTLTAAQERHVADELRDLLVDATRIRLRADVPVGAYLSGGLDSSAITAIIRRFTSNRLCTFSVGFETQEFDETHYQQQVVKALGTEHRSVTCTARDIGRIFPEVIWHAERPVLRTAPAPLYLLSELVRHNGFKVVLTGEGADEVFAGYDIFKEDKIRRFWARQPQSKHRPLLLRRMYPYLNGLQNQPQAYLEAFFRVGLDDPSNPFFSHLPRWVTTSRLKTFFCGDLRRQLAGYSAIDELRDMLPPEFPHWHPLSRAQYLEAAYLLPGYILSAQGDRVAMAHAVEGRFPFLDHRVVEFAAKLPPRTKLRGLVEKSILRQSLAQHLPDDIAHRPKQPYRAPDSQSFVGDDSVAEDYVQDMLSPSAIDRAGYFDARAVGRLLEKCRHAGPLGFRDNMAVVGILSVQLLHEQFVMGAAPKHVPAAAAAHPTPGAAPAALG